MDERYDLIFTHAVLSIIFLSHSNLADEYLLVKKKTNKFKKKK